MCTKKTWKCWKQCKKTKTEIIQIGKEGRLKEKNLNLWNAKHESEIFRKGLYWRIKKQ
jgi:hypothetical protein